MTRQVLAHSTRVNSGVPRRTKLQNILGRVEVAVVMCATLGVNPGHPPQAAIVMPGLVNTVP